uniref:Uncharacterized protein n=1 Tax=Globodera rostochiensis TaxID=31243 RepID=A0A914HS29_GLORO
MEDVVCPSGDGEEETMSGEASHSSLSHTTVTDESFDPKNASVADFVHLEAKRRKTRLFAGKVRPMGPSRSAGRGKNLSPLTKILGPTPSGGPVTCSSAGPPKATAPASAASVVAALKSFEQKLEMVLAGQHQQKASTGSNFFLVFVVVGKPRTSPEEAQEEEG